ncbi:MAG: rhodanese-like domain-containing protein [Oligoflexia bacterium]|nr:rhodanese-like domain-containing protein [Oligoflexia bacterium]
MFKNGLFHKFKGFFHLFLKQYFLKKKKTQTLSEDDLYSLDGYQLKNLQEKNIYFDFFQLDSLNEEINCELKKHLQKAQLKTKENILSQLKTEDLKKPIVLICKTGEASKNFSRALRAKGFVNVYFIKKGFQSLLEDF